MTAKPGRLDRYFLPPKRTMPPFSSMLRTKKGRKSRPRTPPSPGSFYSPSIARSPAPWVPLERAAPAAMSTSPSTVARSDEELLPLRHGPTHPRSPTTASASKDNVVLDLNEDPYGPTHSRRPSAASTSSPRIQAPALHVPSRTLGESSGPSSNLSSNVNANANATAEPGPVSGLKLSLVDAHRRVPTPIKIPRAQCAKRHDPTEPIATPSARPVSNCPSSAHSGSILASPAPSEGAPELMTVLRAERASASVLGLGFSLKGEVTALEGEEREERDDVVVSPSSSVSSAPRAGLRRSTSTEEGLGGSLYPPPPVRRPNTDMSIGSGRPATLYAMDRISEVPSPSFLDPTNALSPGAGGSGRPTSTYSRSHSPSSSFPPTGSFFIDEDEEPTSPPRQRSKTVGDRVTGRELYVHAGAGRQRSVSVSASNANSNSNSAMAIRRARSPSGATAMTYASRPVTPPDFLGPGLAGTAPGATIPGRTKNLQGPNMAGNYSVASSGAGSTGTWSASLGFSSASGFGSYSFSPQPASSTSSQPTPSSSGATQPPSLFGSHTALSSGTTQPTPSTGSGSSSSLDSPPPRTTRLGSAPNATTTNTNMVATTAFPPILSKFTRQPLGFENFSFLGGRGRSASEVTRGGAEIAKSASNSAASSSEVVVEIPARPARPPSLCLRDDPPEPVRLAHSSSSSSTGSTGLGLRRKRSSPAIHTLERKASNPGSLASSTRRKGSDAGIPTIHRTDSSNSSHRTAGTQQPTPTSPTPAGALLTIKQRRETLFPTTPRSFSHEESSSSSPPPPARSPAPSTRKAHLPIGPKSVPVVPSRSEPVPAVTVPVIPTPGPSTAGVSASASAGISASASVGAKPRGLKPVTAPKQPPPSPTFEPVPVRWRGLTMDAAKWTFSSSQLHNIVSRAIKQSAETSCVRLLPLDVLDQELPVEVERLEQLRDVLQTKYKAQVRRVVSSCRLLDELEDVGVVCDQLAEDLYLVGDQLSQIARLRDVHSTSALAVALRKINQSYIRARSEVVELQAERTSLEAERDEAGSWPSPSSASSSNPNTSRRLRRMIPCRPNLRARTSRAMRRSARSSTSSMRYHSILFPRPPTSTSPFIDFSHPDSSSGDLVPPVPPVNLTKHLSSFEPSRPESIGVLPAGAYALSLSPGPGSEVVGVTTPSATSHDLYVAQNELLTMLGLSYKEYGFKIRPRSYSECESPPAVPSSPPGGGAGGVFAARMSGPPSSFHRPSSRGKLFRSSSDQALRRHSSTLERVIAVEVPAFGGVPEDPAAILAALTLPQDL
ncbi:hypothetical protein RhiXN_11018 [Rhizoctonia solani]|uniref:Nascent polypeptide-associated complex subunit alpha, muscle-specific form n=1 Tax=Rhizoctonia solani TaxID=456999 RepID=A0A8H8P8U9_9AGAM|nr:uncharacterized protein RhiXN_11018 [Rhizoctonia solani]QRW25941.1 hypothetical protein RhiXN_11018 [Rhizoctonia solani]